MDEGTVRLREQALKIAEKNGLIRGVDGVTGKLVDGVNNIYPFAAWTSAGIKPEGQPAKCCDTPEEALLAYLHDFDSRTSQLNEGTHIYWRELPSLEHEIDFDKWYVYSRYLIGPAGLMNVDDSKIWELKNMPKTDYLQPGWRSENKGPNPANNSGFRATGHRILLITEEVEEVTSGGIVLVAKTVVAEANRAQVCTVLEIGPDAWADKSTDYCELGDRVLIGQYVGKMHESPVDGKTYRFVSDLDIISPLPPKEAK